MPVRSDIGQRRGRHKAAASEERGTHLASSVKGVVLVVVEGPDQASRGCWGQAELGGQALAVGPVLVGQGRQRVADRAAGFSSIGIRRCHGSRA